MSLIDKMIDWLDPNEDGKVDKLIEEINKNDKEG